MSKVKKKSVEKNSSESAEVYQKKFGKSGENLLNLIAEILVENALKDNTGKGSKIGNQI